VKNEYLLLAAALVLLLVSLWIAFPGGPSLETASFAQAQKDAFNPVWTPLSLKSKGYYRTIVKKGVIPGTEAEDESSQKDERGDIIVIGIADINGKKSVIIHSQRSKRNEGDVVAGEGEEVDGWKVVAIKERSVVLGRGGERRELKIFSPQGSERRGKLVFKRQEPRKNLRRRRIPRRRTPTLRRPGTPSIGKRVKRPAR